jgi:hypothetical protein
VIPNVIRNLLWFNLIEALNKTDVCTFTGKISGDVRMTNVAFGYPYKLERQSNSWWLVRFPAIPEALTEGETTREAVANARIVSSQRWRVT